MAVNFSAIQAVAILTNAAVVYEPSVFNGTGNEIRRNLVLKVDQPTIDQLLALEQTHGSTCSVVKTDTIRVKVDMNAVRVFDADRKSIVPRTPRPEDEAPLTPKRRAQAATAYRVTVQMTAAGL